MPNTASDELYPALYQKSIAALHCISHLNIIGPLILICTVYISNKQIIGGTEAETVGGTRAVAVGGTRAVAVGGTGAVAVGGTGAVAVGGTGAEAVGGEIEQLDDGTLFSAFKNRVPVTSS